MKFIMPSIVKFVVEYIYIYNPFISWVGSGPDIETLSKRKVPHKISHA